VQKKSTTQAAPPLEKNTLYFLRFLQNNWKDSKEYFGEKMLSNVKHLFLQ